MKKLVKFGLVKVTRLKLFKAEFNSLILLYNDNNELTCYIRLNINIYITILLYYVNILLYHIILHYVNILILIY